MRLSEYLVKKRLKISEMAIIAGVSKACIHSIVHGTRRHFSMETVLRIDIATAGRVKLKDMMAAEVHADILKTVKVRRMKLL